MQSEDELDKYPYIVVPNQSYLSILGSRRLKIRTSCEKANLIIRHQYNPLFYSFFFFHRVSLSFGD